MAVNWAVNRILDRLTPAHAPLPNLSLAMALLPTAMMPAQLSLLASFGAILVITGSMLIALGHSKADRG